MGGAGKLTNGGFAWVWDSNPQNKIKAVYVRQDNNIHWAKPVDGIFAGQLTEWKFAAPFIDSNSI